MQNGRPSRIVDVEGLAHLLLGRGRQQKGGVYSTRLIGWGPTLTRCSTLRLIV